MSAGWVYVLGHPMWDGSPERGRKPMVKIGFTRRDPRLRGAEIRSVAGLLAPCRVEFCRFCNDAATVETVVHRTLRHCRVSPRRELFRIEPALARVVIERVAASYLVGPPVPISFQKRRRSFRPNYRDMPVRRATRPVSLITAVAAIVVAVVAFAGSF